MMHMFHDHKFHDGVFYRPETLCPLRVTCPENVYLDVPRPFQFVPIAGLCEYFRVLSNMDRNAEPTEGALFVFTRTR